MDSTIEKAVEALEMMPDDMREHAVARLVEQAEKFRALKAAIDEGMADVEAGRVAPWDDRDFLRRVRASALNDKGVGEMSEATEKAVEANIQLEAARRLARLGGSAPDLVAPPRRRFE